MVWNTPLASLGHLSWVCPLPALTAPPACPLAGQSKRLRCPWLSISTALQQLKHRGVISTLLILSQNTAFHQLLGRKLILCSKAIRMQQDGAEQGGFPWPEPLPVAGPALPFRCPRCGERGRFGRGARVRAKFSRMVEAVDKTMEKRLDRLTGELAQKTAELQEMREAFVKLSQKQQEVQRRERVLSRQVDVAVEMIAALKQRLSEFEEEAEKELQGKARLQHFIENLLQHVDLAERQLEYYQNQQIACSRIADVTRSCLTSNHVSHPFVVNGQWQKEKGESKGRQRQKQYQEDATDTDTGTGNSSSISDIGAGRRQALPRCGKTGELLGIGIIVRSKLALSN
uniref:Zinc finger protein 365 n=1 Tax=Anas platyrhynchos platyrhynchos TaxID=8840 RepID=A0A493U2L1_ANAPP